MEKHIAERRCVDMGKEREIIPVKRVKKDGSLDRNIVDHVVNRLKRGEFVVMPVDSVFGIAGIAKKKTEGEISRFYGENEDDFVRIIASYRMLDEIACIDKPEFDFLHRVWPGEVAVRLKRKGGNENENSTITVRYPKNKFIQDIIIKVNHPLVFTACLKSRNKRKFKINDICNKYHKAGAILLIEEYCKKHPGPTLIDVTRGDLIIENEGKIPAEEIKSLYFL
jgi:tRNA A37 threonylcarbamoyladenosine synthetase subunit TsaC/SUA5/YrdC